MVENRLALEDKNMRKWLYKHGKGDVLDFTDEELKSL
jgi:hypothetical protein